MAEKLNPKQIKFCNEYMIDLNATQAAIRAGYSVKTANVKGSQQLTKVNIQEYISKLQIELQKQTKITPESVVNELAKIGFSNIKSFVNGGNSILELKHLEDHITAAVSGVETTVKEFDGNVTTTTKLRLHDKRQALVDIGRHLGIFEKDGSERTNVNIILSEEAAKAISAKTMKDI